MLLIRPSSSLLKFILPALLIFSTTFYLFHSSNQHSSSVFQTTDDPSQSLPEHQDAISNPPESSRPLVDTQEQLKQAFIRDVIDNEVDGPMNLEPLSELCRNTQWQAGLIVKCQPLPGGIGNVRNMFLNCMRFAIDAGATGFVVPECRHRNDADLSDIHTHSLYPLSYLLDTDFFIKSFNNACPQVKIYPTDAELPMEVTPEMLVKYHVTPIEYAPKLQSHTLIDMPRPQWRNAFDTWLRNETIYPNMSAEKPAFVFITNCLLRWPFMYDTNEFVAQFGRILKIREDARRLAGAVLWALSEKHALKLDYSSAPLLENKFMGAHLRTAADAIKVGWPNYTSQATNYLNSANRTHAKLIYLTTGAPEDAKLFSEAAKLQDAEVTSKEILLEGDNLTSEKKILEEMTWDQRALVDFEVLLRASYFVGMFESSFTWNIALRRHVIVGNGTWLNIEPGHQGIEGLVDPAESFMDQYSAVFGPVDLGIRWQFPRGLYP